MIPALGKAALDHSDRVRIQLVFAVHERAAADRSDSDDAKDIGGCEHGRGADRTIDNDGKRRGPVRRELGEGMLPLAPVEEILIRRSGRFAPVDLRCRDDVELVGVRKRQWTKEQSVGHAEHGRRGADANGDAGHGARRGAPFAPKNATGDAQVAREIELRQR